MPDVDRAGNGGDGLETLSYYNGRFEAYHGGHMFLQDFT